MKRIDVYIGDEQFKRLSELAQDRPLADFIRRAIDEFLERQKRKEEKR